jgi:hypothetical protein
VLHERQESVRPDGNAPPAAAGGFQKRLEELCAAGMQKIRCQEVRDHSDVKPRDAPSPPAFVPDDVVRRFDLASIDLPAELMNAITGMILKPRRPNRSRTNAAGERSGAIKLSFRRIAQSKKRP